jgi:hypothetical protein
LWGITFFREKDLGTEWVVLLLIPMGVVIVATVLFHAPSAFLAGLIAVPPSCFYVSKRIDDKAAAADAA